MAVGTPTVVGYLLWVAEPGETEWFHPTTGQKMTPIPREGYYLGKDEDYGKGAILHVDLDNPDVMVFKTREEAESYMVVDATQFPERLGKYAVHTVIAGFAIKGRVRARKCNGPFYNHVHPSNETETIEGYFGADGSFFKTEIEAPKFRTREIAETLAFNMTLKEHDLISTVEVVEVRHVQTS
jgi:hypothetical protein